jgi:hypothetical protein
LCGLLDRFFLPEVQKRSRRLPTEKAYFAAIEIMEAEVRRGEEKT